MMTIFRLRKWTPDSITRLGWEENFKSVQDYVLIPELISLNDLNADLKKISKWADQSKIQLNPDPNK